jgi:hypothetical protein
VTGRRWWPLLACAALSCRHGAAAGPRIGAAVPAESSREELLGEAAHAVADGRFAEAGVALTVLGDRERRQSDPELDFWSELLALARCEPLVPAPGVHPHAVPLQNPWDQLRRLAQIERVRLARNPAQVAPHAKMLKDPASTERLRRLEDRAPPIRWPLEAERWPDETLVPALADRCVAGGAPERSRPDLASLGEVALVDAVADALPGDHPAAGALWLQAAILDVTHRRAPRATALVARLQASARQLDGLDPRERRALVLATALAALDDPAAPADRVLAAGRAALRLDLSAPATRALSLRLADRLMAAQRPEDAVAILGPPPHGDDAIGRYIAFRQAQAHARANRRAELLAEAREALNRHGRKEVEGDPALGAIMDMALRTLRASPVSPETMEVLEALGPPRERLARAEAFAAGALDGGAPLSAMATFEWLYQNDADPTRQLRHLARACVAAARAGARAEFARTFQLLAGQDKDSGGKGRKDGLIASSEADARRDRRRASLSADWQQALLVVARDALTALVDADDQADLATLVATLKRHLDEAGRGPVDEELTTLYRAASAHLKTGARAYAETVGAERRPILLGDIRVDRTYDVQPPPVDLTGLLEETGTLVFVPRQRDPNLAVRWAGRPAPLAAGGKR